MKPINEVYPESERWFGDYSVLINSFEHKVLLQVDDDDYQGDSRILLKDNDRYGILIFGWGSCSGCDALQGCENLKEVDELRTSLYNSIRWGTLEETLAYMKNHDWKGDYSWHRSETKRFISITTELLEVAQKGTLPEGENVPDKQNCPSTTYCPRCGSTNTELVEDGHLHSQWNERKGEYRREELVNIFNCECGCEFCVKAE